MKDSIGDAMKMHEQTTDTRTDPVDSSEYLYVRVDGRHFSSFVKRLPDVYRFDDRVMGAMMAGVQAVMKDLHADFGYCQSDEASFGWKAKANPLAEHPFNGKIQKLASVVASLFAVAFYKQLEKRIYPDEIPLFSFDGRVVAFPEAGSFQSMFYWRYLDASRNAVNLFTRKFLSQKQMNGVPNAVLKQNWTEDQLNEWNEMLTIFKEGAFFTKERGNVSKKEFVDGFAI